MKVLHRDERGLVLGRADSPSISVVNFERHTLRGIHYQVAPYARGKIFAVLSGAVRLVLVDLDTERHAVVELVADDEISILGNNACGYLTLAPYTIVHYEMRVAQSREHERGIRWNDPFFKIDWQVEKPLMNERDAGWPDYVS